VCCLVCTQRDDRRTATWFEERRPSGRDGPEGSAKSRVLAAGRRRGITWWEVASPPFARAVIPKRSGGSGRQNDTRRSRTGTPRPGLVTTQQDDMGWVAAGPTFVGPVPSATLRIGKGMAKVWEPTYHRKPKDGGRQFLEGGERAHGRNRRGKQTTPVRAFDRHARDGEPAR